MKIIDFDFDIIPDEHSLNVFLEKELDLSSMIDGEYGFNLAAFYDTFSYSNDAIKFNLINAKKRVSSNEWISNFIDYLDDLKDSNPNFIYEIVS